jgi:hypothetical protein
VSFEAIRKEGKKRITREVKDARLTERHELLLQLPGHSILNEDIGRIRADSVRSRGDFGNDGGHPL